MLKPLTAGNWDARKAAHLLNRAGFGGPPVEIENLASLGLERAVSWFVDYERIPDSTPDPAWARPDPERAEKLLALRQAPEEQRRQMVRQEQQLQRERMMELRGWWLQRMTRGPRPLQEKMTLFWHGHFATSNQKVRDTYYMWRQNELFRRLATGNWLQLLVEVAKDPAMLIWLDQAQSRREHPNENFAREVMELFALGEGHYTEKDIAEAARALTGWSLDRAQQRFIERPFQHDAGTKTVLGRTGELDGNDVLEQIVAQPQSAVHITARVWNFFAGEMPSPALNAALTSEFRRGGNNFKPLLRAMFLSGEFYDPTIIRNQIKSPVQWLVGSVRMLECELPPPFVSANLLRSLGQDLFAPPNVKGWDGGPAWITTNTLLARYNEAAALTQGDPSMIAGQIDPKRPNQARLAQYRMRNARMNSVPVSKLLGSTGRADKNAVLATLEERLLQSRLKGKQEAALREYLDGRGELDDHDVRGAIRLIMSTPEYQLA
jgi:uncharacterized protein (DUF1800 family)